MVKAVRSKRCAQVAVLSRRMRPVAVYSFVLAGLTLPEHSNPAFEVVRILRFDSSPGPRSGKRLPFGQGSESLAKFIEIQRPSGTGQTLENICCDQALRIDEPARGAAPR